MQRKTDTPKDTVPASDPFATLEPLLPMTWLGTAWMQNLSALGGELTTFVVDRMKEDVKAQHALLHCKSLEEVQHVQAEFLQKAFDQYQEETGKLVEISGAMAIIPPPETKTVG